jgi:hypothetical protein
MKIAKLMDTPLGDMLQAAILSKPILLVETPDNTKKLVDWAKSQGWGAEEIICCLANWLGATAAMTEDEPQA